MQNKLNTREINKKYFCISINCDHNVTDNVNVLKLPKKGIFVILRLHQQGI